jgi:hypothetical protein
MRVRGQRHAPAALDLRERTPPPVPTGQEGGWVVIRDGVDTETRRKIVLLCRGSKLGRPVCSQTLYRLTYPSSLYEVFVHVFIACMYYSMTN